MRGTRAATLKEQTQPKNASTCPTVQILGNASIFRGPRPNWIVRPFACASLTHLENISH